MKKNELIALGLLTASFFALLACTKKTAEPLDIFENMPQSEVVVEEVKPAEPVLVEVFPEKEVVYVEDETVDAYDEGDIDFYGKDEVKQPAPEVPHTGFPTIKEEPVAETPSEPERPTPQSTEGWNGGGNGVPTTRKDVSYIDWSLDTSDAGIFN